MHYDAYWTKKLRFNICPIGVVVVHFEYFRADAFGIFQLVGVMFSYISYNANEESAGDDCYNPIIDFFLSVGFATDSDDRQ